MKKGGSCGDIKIYVLGEISVIMMANKWEVTLKRNISILRLVGLWPDKENYSVFNPYTVYAIISINVFINGHIFFQTMHIFSVYKNLEALTGSIFIVLIQMLASIKVYYFTQNIGILKELIAQISCKEFQPKNDRQKRVLQHEMNIWQLVYKAFTVMITATLLLFIMFPIMDGSVEDYRLPFLAWYPYDITLSPNYEITYLYQALSIWFLAFAHLNMDTMIPGLMMFLVAQCNILSGDLKRIKFSSFTETFIECVQHHRKILSYASKSNHFFDMIAMGQFFVSAVSIGLAMFQLTLVEAMTSEFYTLLFYLGSAISQIFLYCWFGDEVENKSSQIPYSAFESDWTGIPIEAKKNLLIFIMRAQKPIKMSAINLFSLSLATFTTILRTSWSYFAVLRQVNAQD